MTSALLFALLFAQPVTPPEKCTLSGTVVDSVTGLPLGKVEVVAENPGDRDRGVSTTTDAKGSFLMVDVDPGQYRLSARRGGYLVAYYGTRRASAIGGAVTLIAGQKMENVQFKLAPFGVIAGAVRDSDGELLVQADVLIYSYRYEGGRREIQQVGQTWTDDLGHYRVSDLPPGKYYLSASVKNQGTPAWVDHSVKSKVPPAIAIRTFYPGTTDPASASMIDVVPGQPFTNADITMVRSHAYKVVVHIEARNGFRAGAGLTFLPDGFGGVGTAGQGNADANGNVEITDVPPGTYRLQYGAWEAPKPFEGVIDFTADDGVGCSGNAPVSVGEGDVAVGVVSDGSCPQVTGRIRTEGGKPSQVTGEFFWFDRGMRGSEVYPKADGSFRRTLSPGHHTLDFSQIAKAHALYVRSIRSGNQDLLRDGLTLSGSEHLDLEVVLALDGGTIEGVVSDTDGKPVMGATAVLIPNDPGLRSRIDFTWSGITDQAGHFALKGIAPGDYKLFAWGDIETDSWFDPDVLKNFEGKGEPVTVKANEPGSAGSAAQTVALHLIP